MPSAIVPVAAAILGLWNAWLALREPLGWGGRVRSVALALALLGFLWTAWMAGFIGWTVNY